MPESRADLLFELGTEELPPLALQKLSAALQREFLAGLDQANLDYGEVVSFATPRRLALLIRECQTQQHDREIERRGPALQAAFDNQIRGICEQITEYNAHNYLTLPDGARVGAVRRIEQPSVQPFELERSGT